MDNVNGQVRKLYSIFDKKSAAWESPFAARTHGEAERFMSTLVADRNTSIGQFPEDYSLWNVGHFDPMSGRVEGEKAIPLGEALAFVRKNNQT